MDKYFIYNILGQPKAIIEEFMSTTWNNLKGFLKVTKKRLLRSKVDLVMLTATIVFFFTRVIAGIDVSWVLAVMAVWGFSLMMRLGIAKEVNDERKEK